MSHTRRTFMESAGAWAAGLSAAASPLAAAELQVPKMKFFGAEISRIVLGCNPFGGEGHFSETLRALMRDYYTQDRVVEVMHQCNRFGINAYNATGTGSAALRAFQAEGGKFHYIAQGGRGDLVQQVKALKPLAIYNMGEVVDVAYQTNAMNGIRDWCKKARDLGVVVGVGTHKPEVIALVEEQGWDVDFYAGCVYNRTRTDEEWRKVLNGELMEMSREIYMQSDPPRMYEVMRQTKKPCFAFKILAAGRIDPTHVARAFQTAFDSIKPIDAVMVGMFPRVRDEVQENAEIVCGILATS